MKFLTVKDVAETLRVREATVTAWIRAGKLRALRVGREYRIDETDLANALRAGATAAG